MRLLLDTHVFIWWDSDPGRLSPKVLEPCRDPSNILILSTVSAWEMQIKLQLGKLKLHVPLSELIESQQQINKLEILPVRLEHVLALESLPDHHKDPFDRLLIAQANTEGVGLISKDPVFRLYSDTVTW